MIKKYFSKFFIVFATCLMFVAGIFISTDRIKCVNAEVDITPYNIVYLDSWSSHVTSFSLYGGRCWTDGTNIYYSSSSNHFVLDLSTLTWTTKTWGGLSVFNGFYIWSDGTNIYYSNSSSQYILDVSTSTWTTKNWNGLSSFSGDGIWTDGTNIYYSSSSLQYVLDVSTSTWTTKNWNGLSSFDGYNIWTEGTYYYYSYGANQYVLDISTSTWSSKTWTGLTDFYGSEIWSDGTNIYYSNTTYQYVLDISTSTWSSKTWTGLTDFSGSNIFSSFGVIILYGYRSTTWYTLDSQQVTPPIPTPTPLTFNQTWSYYTATGPYSSVYLTGNHLWTDGTNIYCSSGNVQLVLDISTSTWINKIWNGYSSILGDSIWTDGTNIYYSFYSSQYVLDVATSTWSSKTWNGLSSFDGGFIWIDGINTYYSNSSEQYVLDKATSTWSVKTWTGLSSFSGAGVWFANNSYYTYANNTFYILDVSTSTWSSVNITGISNFSYSYVWNDGTNTYYSDNSNNYIFDSVNSAWVSTTFVNLTNFYGYYVFSYPTDFIIYLDSNDFSYYLLNTGSNSGGGNSTSTNYTFNGSNYITFGYSTINSLSSNYAYIFNSYFDIVDNTDVFTITMTSRGLKYSVTSQGFLQQTTTNPADTSYTQSLTLNIGTSYTDYSSSSVFSRYFKVTTSGWSNSNIIACAISSELNVDTNDNTKYYILYHFNYINTSNEILYVTIVVHTSRSLLDEYTYLINDYILLSSRTIYFTQNTGSGGFADGYNTGYEDGQQIGYTNGYDAGSSASYSSGYNAGLTDGDSVGYSRGYSVGYNAGIQSANDYSFFGLISAVVDAPFTYFKSILNFDLLGFNILNFMTALLTLALVVVVVKKLMGR